MNHYGRYLDARDQLLVERYGHGRMQRMVGLYKLGVIDKQVVTVPAGTEVIGLKVVLGEIHLKLLLGTAAHFVDRYFYAYDNGQYMSNPRLGYINSIRVGDSMWHVFEDDMAWHYKRIHPEGESCTS